MSRFCKHLLQPNFLQRCKGTVKLLPKQFFIARWDSSVVSEDEIVPTELKDKADIFKDGNKENRPVVFKRNEARCKSLYTPAWLKLYRYETKRRRYLEEYPKHIRDEFVRRMESYMNESPENGICSDDLSWLLYTAQTDTEINLAVRMFLRYGQMKDEYVVEDIDYSTTLLRLCHTADQVELVHKLITDKELSQYFRGVTSLIVAMDLFFIHERYDYLLDAYDVHLSEVEQSNQRINQSILYLTAATYWKQNTGESYEKMKQLALDRKHGGLRGLCIAAHSALMHNEPDLAWRYLEQMDKSQSVLAYSLRVLTLTQLKKPEAAVKILKNLIKGNSQYKLCILSEAVQSLEELVMSGHNKDLQDTLTSAITELQGAYSIVNKSLTEVLFHPVHYESKDTHADISGIAGSVNS